MRGLLLCSTIVAAFQLPLLAAAPATTDVPVTAPVAALAVRLGLEPARDRGRLVAEIIRLAYTPPAHRRTRLTFESLAAAPSAQAPPVTAPFPLTRATWTRAVLRRTVSDTDLLAAVLADERAALLCRGLAGLDDETLAFYADHPDLLTYLHEHAAPAFAAFGASVRVRDGRLEVPGGPDAEPLWEAAVLARVDAPDAFVRALFADPGARLAYLFETLAAASPEARAFALGSWMADDTLRRARFLALAAQVQANYGEWDVNELPFTRPLGDLALLLLRLRVTRDGTPAPPASRAFWANALGYSKVPSATDGPQPEVIDAAWLLQAIAGSIYARGDRLDQIGFGQRVFARVDESVLDEAAAIIAELPHRRMLLLGVERLGILNPSVYRALLRQARGLATDGAEAFWALTQFEGGLSIVDRMARVGSLDSARTERLLLSLAELPLRDGAWRGSLGGWIERTLASEWPRRETREAALVAAVAGPAWPRNLVTWEGERYRLDIPFAERRRIERTRAKQGGADLDAALEYTALASAVAGASTAADLTPLAARAADLHDRAGALFARPAVNLPPPGVPLPPDGREALARARDELARAARAGDLRRAHRAGETLLTVADAVLGQTLVSVVYAMYLGDPEGPSLLGANVALRHDFGIGRRDGEGRERTPWAVPHQDFRPGVPWHVSGSLLGLDLALAPLSLRRLAMDVPESPPQIASLDREGIAVNMALLDPRRLSDADRDRLAIAVSAGRTRVRALGADPRAVDAVVTALALDGWRERDLRWTLQNRQDSVENLFSMGELAWLGGNAPADAWGANGLATAGCACARFPSPRQARVLEGRAQLPTMAASMIDMHLELAARFLQARLPSALLPSVLATALQDLLDQAKPTDPHDLLAVSRYVRGVPQSAFENYVAASATLDGPLVLDDGAGETLEP